MSQSVTATAVARLEAACKAAYAAYPNSCSHAVWHVIKTVQTPGQPFMNANSLVDWLGKNWSQVDSNRAWELAQAGIVAVGGLKDTPNGHVVVVYPGAKKPRGGYTATNSAGKLIAIASKGSYPRAMSTSMGTWPGAMSDGTKTVWDPWGNDTVFATVRFWVPLGTQGSTPAIG